MYDDFYHLISLICTSTQLLLNNNIKYYLIIIFIISSALTPFKIYTNSILYPNIYLCGRVLDFITKQKYLGYMITDDFKDDTDITSQIDVFTVWAIALIGILNFVLKK